MLFSIFKINNTFFYIILDIIKPYSSEKLEELLFERFFSFYWVILDARYLNKITSITDLSEGLISISFGSEFSFKFSEEIIKFWSE